LPPSPPASAARAAADAPVKHALVESLMQYDYIVVGGGSAGCVTAGRLVREFGARVLLLEQGRRDNHPLIRMPAGFVKLLGDASYLTLHETEKAPHLGGRSLVLPQGKVLGGGSSINAMVYIRGQASDYDGWQETTGTSFWSFENLLPAFRGMEDNDRLNNAMHGIGGPLKVSDTAYTCDISRAFVRAAQAAGLPFNHDFNGGRQLGVGYYQLTAANGRRCSAVDAFLRPVMRDRRLTLQTGAQVARVIVENGRATGVEYTWRGQRHVAHAPEIVLTAGALVTPKLLMLSGIGPAQELERLGLPVHADLPGVGGNLQDHHEVPTLALCNGPYGYFGQDKGVQKLRNGLQYMMHRSGPVVSNGLEAGAFYNTKEDGDDADIQFFCVPSVYVDKDIKDVTPAHGFTLNACLLRPKSRGSVRLRNTDPSAPPMISTNFLNNEDDLQRSIAALRFARKVIAAQPLRGMVSQEVWPGPGADTDEALARHCYRTVKTVYHPVGTARMGRDEDPMAVVTPDLKVKGVAGLRVLDTSVLPTLVSGNTNAVALAVAHRGVSLMVDELRIEQEPRPVQAALVA